MNPPELGRHDPLLEMRMFEIISKSAQFFHQNNKNHYPQYRL